MGILIYLTPTLSVWAILATGVALVRGRHLRRERDEHASVQDTLGRYQAALAQLKARAETSARELAVLQRTHASLKQSLELQAEAQAQAALAPPPPPPMVVVMVERLDIATEIGTLLVHVARVARTLRRFSAYTRGHHGSEPVSARYDLHWLSDCLHSFDQLGYALTKGSLEALIAACQELLSIYDPYLKDASGYNSRDTFQRLSSDVPLSDVTDALRSIAVKAALAQDVVLEDELAGAVAHAG